MQYAESALVLANTLDYKKGIVDSYNNITIAYMRMGYPPEALENYFTCLKIFEEIGHKGGIASSCYINIGNVYADDG